MATTPHPSAVNASGALAGRTLTAISAGGLHVCAIADNSRVYCWGENGSGQLGNDDATKTDLDVPDQADPSNTIGPATVTDIAAGGEHTCVVVSTNVPWCWGEDSNGQLGDNQSTDRIVPVPVVASGVLAGKPQHRIGAGFPRPTVRWSR